MGSHDTRKDAVGGIDFRIQRQLRAYKKADAPPKRVKPIPITIILHLLHAAHDAKQSDDSQAIADLTVIAFCFLLRPGECTGTTTDDAAFTLDDVTLHLHNTPLDTMTAPISQIEAAAAVTLTFTTQKNGTRGEAITHGRSGHPHCCPAMATTRRVIHHRLHKSKASTPLASFCNPRTNRRNNIKAKDVTDVLKHAAAATRSTTGIDPKDVTARSLRAGGAMALLCGNVDHNLIQMLGRWHSDAMMRCLHLQAQPIMNKFVAKMFNNGQHSFNPEETVPIKDEL